MNQNNFLRIIKTPVASIYSHYITKIERKNKSKNELDEITRWLTGYTQAQLDEILENNTDFQTFFNQAPLLNPNAHKITGLICGYRVEEIEDQLMRNIRYLDKLVDELSKGKTMEKILRK